MKTSNAILLLISLCLFACEDCKVYECPKGTYPTKSGKQCICFKPQRHIYVMRLNNDGGLIVEDIGNLNESK